LELTQPQLCRGFLVADGLLTSAASRGVIHCGRGAGIEEAARVRESSRTQSKQGAGLVGFL
jgi:hypothetical protein